VITGGCLCGAVRYQAEGEPLFALHCHCRDCQRASGTGHVPIMGMPQPLFRVTGETRSYAVTGSSGHKAIRNFCPRCGSLLFGTPEVAPHVVTLYAGSLDDPTVFKPQFAQFARSRPAWDRMAAPLREFDTVPPNPHPTLSHSRSTRGGENGEGDAQPLP
jgi:hypothetical protein